MKKLLKISAILLAVTVLAVSAVCITLRAALPDQWTVNKGESLRFARTGLMTGAPTVTADSYAVGVSANAGGYSAKIKLLGIVPIKTVWVNEIQETAVGVSGAPFGIKLYSEGVMIVGFTDIRTPTGYQNPAKAAGLRMGDTVTGINGVAMRDNAQVQQAVVDCGGNPLTVEYTRKGESLQCTVIPMRETTEDTWRIGMRVRDSTAGIGTLTFICEQDGVYAGLGHPVTDVDTGEEIALLTGQIVPVEITDYTQSSSGAPGELKGILSAFSVGEIAKNGETGIFGKLYGSNQAFETRQMTVALRQEVTTGPAEIYCCIDGSSPKVYAVEIERIRYSEENLTKNMIIRITDDRLLEQTGGIVQGMSGSPVVQNQKLVGAVTHVLVNDPTRGYAIFAENMLQDAQKLA